MRNKKWKLKYLDDYYYITNKGHIVCDIFSGDGSEEEWKILTGNFFETKEQAKKYRDNLRTKDKLKRLAEELNGDTEIDWENPYQKKYYIYYNYPGECLQTMCLNNMQSMDIYCLDDKFLEKAVDRIGKERLINMIKEGK